jgi:hypothetical protein
MSHTTIRQHLISHYNTDIAKRPISTRAAHIIRTYQKQINHLPAHAHIRAKHLLERCLADLAGANGNPECTQRARIQL